MAVYFSSLNSGSNANCYYVSNGDAAILVDAGLSCRETEKRMKRLGLEMEQVKAIFISHEHSDHINGLEVLSRKHKLPVYISQKTLANSNLSIDPSLVRYFRKDETVEVDQLLVKCFSKSHDAADPFSFTPANRYCIIFGKAMWCFLKVIIAKRCWPMAIILII
jgi:phosphoribosyl 1,2-cyclic phosphodiesterase